MRKTLAIMSLLLLCAVGFRLDPAPLQAYDKPSATVEEFYGRYSNNHYAAGISIDAQKAEHWGKISKLFKISAQQQKALQTNGFVVLGNVYSDCFGNAYKTIYEHHLPVFISADSILHAFHCSFDEILKEVEVNYLSRDLDSLLSDVAKYLSAQKYENTELAMGNSDASAFVEVALCLLRGQKSSGNATANYFLGRIQGLKMVETDFFGDDRTPDFSQFIPRGHYTKSEDLKKYFRAMMWLGRAYMNYGVKRNGIMSLILIDAIQKSGNVPRYKNIDGTIELFVGRPDSLTLEEMVQFAAKNRFDLDRATDGKAYNAFVVKMKESRIGLPKMSGDAIDFGMGEKKKVLESPQFCFMGQRYTVDSHILETTAWYPERPLPDAIDVAFVLGSGAAVDVLREDIGKSGVRLTQRLEKSVKIMKEAPADLFDRTLYHAWLKSLSSLFPDGRSAVSPKAPYFMKTRAWSYCKLNTMLGSYAQLRHDTILYAKPAYSDGACDFPSGYIEPNPVFFSSMKKLGKKASSMLEPLQVKNQQLKNAWVSYFATFANICGILEKMAAKELEQQPFSADEQRFIKQTLSVVYDEFGGCGPSITYLDGWFYRMFYNRENATEFKAEIADIANYPYGNRALYVATGMVDYGVFAVDCGSSVQLFVGPTYQFYQFQWPMADRLTDERWETLYAEQYKNRRPQWTGNYMVTSGEPSYIEQLDFTERDDVFVEDYEADFQVEIKRVMKKANEYKVFLDTMIGMESAQSRPREAGLIEPIVVKASQEDVYSTDHITRMRYNHGTYCLFDNDPGTAWVANRNRGIGAWVMVYLEDEKKINKVGIHGGWDYVHPQYGDLLTTNNRLKEVKLSLYGKANEPVYEKVLKFDGSTGIKYFDVPNVKASKIKIEVIDVIPGSKYKGDTCINEMKIYGK